MFCCGFGAHRGREPRSRRLSTAIGGKGATLPPDEVIAALAGRQHGVVGRAQLLAAGIGPRAIERRVRSGRLHPLHRGVYAVGHRVRLTARPVDGRDPGDGRRPKPPLRRRAVGHPPLGRADRDHDPHGTDDHATRPPPSPRRSRPRTRSRSETASPSPPPPAPSSTSPASSSSHQLQQVINEAERLRLEGPPPHDSHPTEAGHRQPPHARTPHPHQTRPRGPLHHLPQ